MNPDWEDFRRARRGDESAWRRLVDRHRPRLSTMAFLICGRSASAADCVQEAFVRLAHSPPTHEQGSLSGYLSTMVYRLAVKELYRQRRLSEIDDTNIAESARTPLENVIKDEEERLTYAAIQMLDDVHRHVLVLRFYGNHSYEEIAELTHVPIGTVKSRLFYAVKLCREVLEKRGVTR